MGTNEEGVYEGVSEMLTRSIGKLEDVIDEHNEIN